jgi:uncharacterized protein (TIGR03085 family)
VRRSSMRQVTHFAPIERAALADLMLEVGPDAPTLCAGWTTRDLAAHLVVRLTRVDAAPGIVVPALGPHLRRVQDKVAAEDWATLVAKVRRRPWWVAVGDEALNRIEYFVHHEDVRRCQPGWQPRELSPEFAQALWSRVRVQAKLALRKTPATVTLGAAGFGSVTAGRGGPGSPGVNLVGAPSELLLFLMGRQEHAIVELAGPADVTGRMLTARFGI